MERDIVEELKQKKRKETNIQYLAEKARLLHGQIRFFFLAGPMRKIPRLTDRPILPVLVPNQNTGFASTQLIFSHFYFKLSFILGVFFLITLFNRQDIIFKVIHHCFFFL